MIAEHNLMTLTKPPQAIAGFTLIELMISLSIAAILLGIAVPSMLNTIRDARLARQSDLLVGTLNLARMEAIRQRTDFQVCPAESPNSATDCTKGASWSAGVLAIAGTNIIQRESVNPSVTLTSTVTSVRFSGTIGNATVSQFQVCVKGRTEHWVDVSFSGRVSKRIGTSICP